jgi:CRP-like cAMP-binding protein
MRSLPQSRLRSLLLPLLADSDPAVAAEALRTAREIGGGDFIFVPTLVSLLRNRRLKSAAREVLVGYGEPVLDALGYFLREADEDIWVRRHLPATIVRIPGQKAMDVLVGALGDQDGFLRYKVVSAIEKLHRQRPELTFQREPFEQLALSEARQYFIHLSHHYNLFVRAGLPGDSLLARALQEKMARALDRVYRLMGLLYPWKDVSAARWAIEHGDARSKASALEYLDNVLTGALRKRLMPALEDTPLDEKVRKANVWLRTRPRNEEETLLELINDEDEVISAASIDLVRERQLWSLEADIEHVLAHRDVRDWHVFEAASWALAERRMPDEQRRQRWLEPLPATVIVGRLRQLPLFASVGVDELFRMAAAGRQARFESGRTLVQPGTVPDCAQFLLDGRAEADENGGAVAIHAPSIVGFSELLEGRAFSSAVRATDVTVTLTLTSDELRTLFADNTDLVEGLFRTLVGLLSGEGRGGITRAEGARPAETPEGGPGTSLTPIEKVLALRSVPIFSGVAAEEMVQLASIARQVPLEPGTTQARESDPPALYVLLSGELTLDAAGSSGEPPTTAAAGDVVGLVETLAGTPIGRTVVVSRTGCALRIEREDLFDLLGQQPTLLQQLFSALFRSARLVSLS